MGLKISLSFDRRFLICSAFMSKADKYSDACPFSALKTMTHVWYLTRLGKGSHLNSWNICCEGVIMSAFRIIQDACFCNFDSLFKLWEVHWDHIMHP